MPRLPSGWLGFPRTARPFRLHVMQLPILLVLLVGLPLHTLLCSVAPPLVGLLAWLEVLPPLRAFPARLPRSTGTYLET